MLRKPASKLTLAEAALIAGIIRAPALVLALDAFRRRPAAQLRRAAADARGREDHRRAGAGGARRADPHPAAAGRDRARSTASPRNTCGSSSATSTAATIRPTGRWRRRSCPEIQDAAEAAVRDGLRRLGVEGTAGRARRDGPAHRQPARHGRRLGFRDQRRSTAPSAAKRQPGSAFKPFVYAAALEQGLSPVSMITGLRQVAIAAPQGVWIPRDERDDRAGRTDAARRAARVEQRRRRAAAAAGGQRARCCGWPATLGCGISPTCRRWRSAAVW